MIEELPEFLEAMREDENGNCRSYWCRPEDPSSIPLPPNTEVSLPEFRSDEVVAVAHVGGCHYCWGRTDIFADGTVTSWSRPLGGDPVELAGVVDPELLKVFLETAAATDFDALVERMSVDSCPAQVDGGGFGVSFPWLDTKLTDCDARFDPVEPFFANYWAMVNSIELESA